MKICIIGLQAYPLFNPEVSGVVGGAEVQLTFLAKELAKHKDLQVSIMLNDHDQADFEKRAGVGLWKVKGSRKGTLQKSLGFFNTFNKIAADIYIQRTLSPFSGLIALYCRMRNIKLVYMVANDFEFTKEHPSQKSLLSRIAANLVFKYAHLIVAQNKFQTEKLKAMGRESLFLKSGFPLPPENSYTPGRYHLWVGRSTEVKNPFGFLELAKNLPEEKFLMICQKYNRASEEQYQKLLDAADNIPNLQFIKSVPFHEIDQYFKEAKTLVSTSYYEGFPNTFMQAAKNSKAILSFKVNPSNILTDYHMGFSCEESIDLLTKKTRLLSENEDMNRLMSKNARNYFNTNHDIQKNALSLLGALKGLGPS